MSMAPAQPESPSPLGRAQWLAEEVLETSGLSCIQLRIAALFFENLELLHREDILGDGVMRNSFPNVSMNWIAGSDAGKLAVAALLHPERFGTKSAVYPSGGEKYTHREVAEIIGSHMGRVLKHETILAEAWQERLMKLSQYDDRINSDMARHISAVGASMRQPFPLNDLFETVTKERPMTISEALRSGYLAFERVRPLVHPAA
jgi:nucleoside-diphosphate-sugar epimerase